MMPCIAMTSLRITSMTTYSSWERCIVMSERISNLTIRERRAIFNIIKDTDPQHVANALLPTFGFTIGEFAVWYVINECNGKRLKP